MKYKVRCNLSYENRALFLSKVFWITIVITFILATISPYLLYKSDSTQIKNIMSTNSSKTVWGILSNGISGDFLMPFIIIIVAFIVGKDYSSGEIKNIFMKSNRNNNLLSKYLVMLESVLLLFIVTLIGAMSSLIYVKIKSWGDFSSFIRMLVAELMVISAIGCITMLVSFLTQKMGLTIAISLVYYLIIYDVFFNILNRIIHKFSALTDFNIKKYTLANSFNYLVGDLSAKTMWRIIIIALISIIFSVTLTSLAANRQDVQ